MFRSAVSRSLAVRKAVAAAAASGSSSAPTTAIRTFTTSRPRMGLVEITIDGKPVQVEQGAALIQACEKAGVDIPRFCYHDRLAIAGNCRMCLVEVEKSPKPVASCAMPVMPGMKVKTNTPVVKKAREGVMEFLLANHPLDCPICDQGGECDLQDQSVRYGGDRSRFSEPVGKRAVEDKDLGPLVKTTMTRCIQCTRCVRFANEVAGVPDLGTTGRGNDTQIGTYVEKAIASEMSGNLVDLCPVGALTAKPYEFKARPWELRKVESIDVLDAVGSNIRVDARGVEVMRILPRENDDINEEWISDKTRYAYDGLRRQRLTTPLIRKGDEFVPATWEEALKVVADAAGSTNANEMVAVAGDFADAESLVSLRDWFHRMGADKLAVDAALPQSADVRSTYLFNTAIRNVEDADAVLLIGTNPRHEAPIINTRLRKGWLAGSEIALVGAKPELNYDVHHIGESAQALSKLIDGSHEFAGILAKAKKPMIVIGSGVYGHADSKYILSAVQQLVQDKVPNLSQPEWNGVAVLHRAASHVAALDAGYKGYDAQATGKAKFVYLLNADNVDAKDVAKDAFVVYQGHHGDNGASLANVILPGAAYTEKSATYVNTEGRAQSTVAAVSPPGVARDDWQIIRALSEVSGSRLPYDDIEAVRERMHEVSPTLVSYSSLEPATVVPVAKALSAAVPSVTAAKPSGVPLSLIIDDFYLTDPISRASSTMAKCSVKFTKKDA
ncbi:NADH dehydrogenase 78K chain precursor, 5-prime end [Catenaria anguillulae PL171]|uniref:NADH-ubiquinone oxidoreductase 78 kDa subunit, mitochondrial n=1 Tax=Catenaria anguillulae PL171 TaxID=765915 RepID=A0A1Y2H4F4_9FUNG|nr:NADH dehydrogenase 78K chain precursor, 5-prime end [Catenaria anguillulae PL171]